MATEQTFIVGVGAEPNTELAGLAVDNGGFPRLGGPAVPLGDITMPYPRQPTLAK